MTHGTSQSTLFSPAPERSLDDLDSAGLLVASWMLAVDLSVDERAPITPCTHYTLDVIECLSRMRWIHLGQSNSNVVLTLRRAIYDPVLWYYPVELDGAADLRHRLRNRTRASAVEPESQGDRLFLWAFLANAEVEGYLMSLLRRHGFDPLWAIDVRDGHRFSSGTLTLAQMRYVVWAAVREGASVYLRSNGQMDEVREAIVREIRRRT